MAPQLNVVKVAQGGRKASRCGEGASCPQPATHAVKSGGTAIYVGCEWHAYVYVAGYRGERPGSLGARMTAAGAPRGKAWVNRRPDGTRIAPSRHVSGPQTPPVANGGPDGR